MSSAPDSSAGNEPIGNYEARFARKIAAVAKPSARPSSQGSGSAGKFGGGGAVAVGVLILIRLVASGVFHSSRYNDTPSYSPPAYKGNVDWGQIQRDADARKQLDEQRQIQDPVEVRMDRVQQPQPWQPPGVQGQDEVPRGGLPGARPRDDINRGGLPGQRPGEDFNRGGLPDRRPGGRFGPRNVP
jgi:hypothetical protein